jgi:hypothetical protein
MADERYLDQQEQSGDAGGPPREIDALRMFGNGASAEDDCVMHRHGPTRCTKADCIYLNSTPQRRVAKLSASELTGRQVYRSTTDSLRPPRGEGVGWL